MRAIVLVLSSVLLLVNSEAADAYCSMPPEPLSAAQFERLVATAAPVALVAHPDAVWPVLHW